MRYRLFRLRLPLIIFIILILASCVTSYAIIYYTLARHLVHGDYLRLETEYLEIEFPKNWFAVKWEDKNATSGNAYNAILSPPNLYTVMVFTVYDKNATQTYMKENGLNDAFSIVIFEVKRIHNWTLQTNNNATLSFEKNGTIIVSNCEANYTIFNIKDGFKEDNVIHNATGIVVSGLNQEKIVQIIFYGEENDWKEAYNTFMDILLNSTKI